MKKFIFSMFTLLYSVAMFGSCGCIGGLWGEAEFLWWKPSVSNNRVATATTGTAANGTIEHYFLNYDWRPGVRASVGMDQLFCGWDLWGSYTYIQPSGHFSLSGVLDSDFLANNFDLSPFGYSEVTSLRQKHQFTYQTWEILTSKWTFVTPCGVLRPFLGVEGLILDQNLKVGVTGTTPLNALAFNNTLDYNGVGLKAGMDVIYPFGGCFNAFINPSFVMVYGQKNLKWRINGFENTVLPAPPVNVTSHKRTGVFVHGYDLQLGVSYATTFCSHLVGAKAGWEFLQWSNVPQINIFNTANDTLTLGFQGLFVSAFFVF